MKAFNILVFVLVFGLGTQLFLSQTPPPKDPWFQNVVATYPRPVLVKFGADWCPPCRHMETVLDRAQGSLSGKVKIVRIDVDEKPELARHYGVSSIPRVFLFQDGKILATSPGFGDAESLQAWVEKKIH